MSIGVISDIHGNLPALEAVFAELSDVGHVICAGDIVGYGPWPRACLERVRETCTVVVQGNHDRSVEEPSRYAHHEMAKAGLEHAKTELTASQIEWLTELPPRTTFAGDQYRLVHSHPDPDKLGSYVRPREFPRMRPYLDDHAGLILGHTHVQHEAVIDNRLIVNPGSVGQPRDGESTAAYAVLEPDAGEMELRRTEYDINRVITQVEELDLPTKTGTRLLDGS